MWVEMEHIYTTMEKGKTVKEKTIEEWLLQARTKYIRPGSRMKLCMHRLAGSREQKIKDIKELLEDNIIVDARWISTDVREYHENIIFYKKKES